MGRTARKLLAVGKAWHTYGVIDASIVAFSPDLTLIDDRWVIVVDPRAIDRNDIAIRLTSANLAGEDDDDQNGKEG